MKGRYVQLQGGKKNPSYMFDRKLLIEGYTTDGVLVPSGGVLLGNGNIAGYVQSQTGGNDRQWTVVGKVDHNDPNSQHIPSHHRGGGVKSSNRSSKDNRRNTGGKKNDTPVSLKTAVKMLRSYYRNNFN